MGGEGYDIFDISIDLEISAVVILMKNLTITICLTFSTIHLSGKFNLLPSNKLAEVKNQMIAQNSTIIFLQTLSRGVIYTSQFDHKSFFFLSHYLW